MDWRLSDEPIAEDENEEWKTLEQRKKIKATIYLGYTSNLISSGLRDVLRFLVQHKFVDAIVTTGGGIEEDLMKCFTPTFIGDFDLNGAMLRSQGMNRIGNTLVPNNNYVVFEKWITPILDKMLIEQNEARLKYYTNPIEINSDTDPSHYWYWTPSKIISRLGKEVNHPDSVYYWAHKNNIPVYCPAITDGSIGDMIFFHSFNKPGLIIDLVADIRAINLSAMKSKKTGMVILGGGVVKHHICNANLMRNGSDFSVFINTAQEFDGSDAGAKPDEAVSWGKIKIGAKPVKVHADATIVFPLIVSQTFAKRLQKDN